MSSARRHCSPLKADHRRRWRRPRGRPRGRAPQRVAEPLAGAAPPPGVVDASRSTPNSSRPAAPGAPPAAPADAGRRCREAARRPPVAQAVVDHLETVEVEQDQRDRGSGLRRVRSTARQDADEGASRHQAGSGSLRAMRGSASTGLRASTGPPPRRWRGSAPALPAPAWQRRTSPGRRRCGRRPPGERGRRRRRAADHPLPVQLAPERFVEEAGACRRSRAAARRGCSARPGRTCQTGRALRVVAQPRAARRSSPRARRAAPAPPARPAPRRPASSARRAMRSAVAERTMSASISTVFSSGHAVAARTLRLVHARVRLGEQLLQRSRFGVSVDTPTLTQSRDRPRRGDDGILGDRAADAVGEQAVGGEDSASWAGAARTPLRRSARADWPRAGRR